MKKYFVSTIVEMGHAQIYEEVSESLFVRLLELSVMDMTRRDPWEYHNKLQHAKASLVEWDFSDMDFVIQGCAFKIEKS